MKGIRSGTDSVDSRRRYNTNFGNFLFMEQLNYLVAGSSDFKISASCSYVLHTMLETLEIRDLLVFMQLRIPKNTVSSIPRRTPQIALINTS